MGLFSRAGAALAHVDRKLIKSGLPARGEVLKCDTTSVSVGSNGPGSAAEQMCDVTVKVTGLAGRPPYQATCRHPIPVLSLPQMRTPGTTVAVRVEPNDPQHIALDLAEQTSR